MGVGHDGISSANIWYCTNILNAAYRPSTAAWIAINVWGNMSINERRGRAGPAAAGGAQSRLRRGCDGASSANASVVVFKSKRRNQQRPSSCVTIPPLDAAEKYGNLTPTVWPRLPTMLLEYPAYLRFSLCTYSRRFRCALPRICREKSRYLSRRALSIMKNMYIINRSKSRLARHFLSPRNKT